MTTTNAPKKSPRLTTAESRAFLQEIREKLDLTRALEEAEKVLGSEDLSDDDREEVTEIALEVLKRLKRLGWRLPKPSVTKNGDTIQ